MIGFSISSNFSNSNKMLVYEAKEQFEKMATAALKENYRIRAISAYRSYQYQKGLYDSYQKQDGTSKADTYSARPGYSEHQTGLAADIVSYDWLVAGKGLTADFAEDPAAIWLKEHAHEYGFILRYPEDKTEVTGIGFEPWHFRFVGVEVATVIMEEEICLEEYFELYP